MQYDDEKDYIMRMIKELARVLFSLIAGKQYVQVELPEENKYEVSGKNLREYKDMIDQGMINEAENLLLSDIDYNSREEVTAAILIYQYISEKGEAFLDRNHYSLEEVYEGLELLAERTGYKEMCDVF